MALPEKPARERLKRWIHGHQGEHGQLSLGCKQTIKGVAVGHGVAACMETVLQGDRQQLKPLVCKQPGQIIEQFPARRELAKTHLGGDLPARRSTHVHPVGRFSNGRLSLWREAIGLSQPPERGMGIEQQLQGSRCRHRRGCSKPASSSSGRASSSTAGVGKVNRPASTPGLRREVGCSKGTSRAQGLPPLATTIVSPAWAASIRREKWVLASCTFTMRWAGVRWGEAVTGGFRRKSCQHVSPPLDQVGGQC